MTGPWGPPAWRRRTLALLWTAGALACGGTPDPAALVRLETSPAGEHTLVTLIPASDVRLNARLKPALELADGSVLRFDSARLTADSAYFAEPPVALLPGRHPEVRGTLRASICENDAPVCRALVLEL
ncbi:MAG TPA: hypothetical protein VMN37_11875 [Gemmatimonadales bacterium]|nr:hypothetical protein [Gemmatimonadales bacterium]